MTVMLIAAYVLIIFLFIERYDQDRRMELLADYVQAQFKTIMQLNQIVGKDIEELQDKAGLT